MSKVLRLMVTRRETEVADYVVPDDAIPEDILEWARMHTVRMTPPSEFQHILTSDILPVVGDSIRSVEVIELAETVIGCELREEEW